MLCSVLLALSLQTTPEATPGLEAALSQTLDSSGFSGVALIAEGDQILARHTQGDAAPDRPHTLERDWGWASVSKQVMAVLALRAVQEGRLTLDAPIRSVWPDAPVETADQLTIRDLMRHTTGLADFDDLSVSAFQAGFDPIAFCDQPPKAPPGGPFDYNNCDTILLGRLLEHVYAEPLETLLQAHVFLPAGMDDVRLGGAEDYGDVLGYGAKTSWRTPLDLGLFGASAGLVGPPEDLVRFNAALMSGQLLSDDLRAQLWQGDPGRGYVALGAWSFSAPLEGCEAPLALIERRGSLSGLEVRNLMAPALNRSLIVFSNHGDPGFGEIWMGQGLTHDLASLAFCTPD